MVHRIPFINFAINNASSVHPGVSIFPEEAVKTAGDSKKEAVATDCKEHITGACRSKVTPGSVQGGNIILVEQNCPLDRESYRIRATGGCGQGLSFPNKIGIFTPRLKVSWGCKKKEGDKREEENSKNHNLAAEEGRA